MPGVDSLIGEGLGLAESVVGLINRGKTQREAAQLQANRPKLKDSPYLKDQLALSESELSTGMSGEAKNAYEQGIDRDLSTSLDAILKGGGSVNNVGSIFGQSEVGRQRLTMMKDNLRLNQINNLVRSRDAKEEERQKEFQFNEWMPWADQAQANAQARQGAESQIWGGLGTAGSVAMKSAETSRNKNELNNSLNFSSSPTSSTGDNSGGTGSNSSMLSDLLSENGGTYQY
jgi:hypothetical protein